MGILIGGFQHLLWLEVWLECQSLVIFDSLWNNPHFIWVSCFLDHHKISAKLTICPKYFCLTWLKRHIFNDSLAGQAPIFKALSRLLLAELRWLLNPHIHSLIHYLGSWLLGQLAKLIMSKIRMCMGIGLMLFSYIMLLLWVRHTEICWYSIRLLASHRFISVIEQWLREYYIALVRNMIIWILGSQFWIWYILEI